MGCRKKKIGKKKNAHRSSNPSCVENGTTAQPQNMHKKTQQQSKPMGGTGWEVGGGGDGSGGGSGGGGGLPVRGDA